jgi:hypothetical protein
VTEPDRSKLVPIMVRKVPPGVRAEVGEMLVIVGAAYEKVLEAVTAVWPGIVTMTLFEVLVPTGRVHTRVV